MKRSVKLAVGVAAAAAILSLPSQTAAANAPSGPFRSGDNVQMYWYTITPNGTHARGELQRHRWYGWQTLSSKSFDGGGDHFWTFTKSCGGTGTYTYRGIEYWYNAYGTQFIKVGGESRFAC